jgi:hypothetical protein
MPLVRQASLKWRQCQEDSLGEYYRLWHKRPCAWPMTVGFLPEIYVDMASTEGKSY